MQSALSWDKCNAGTPAILLEVKTKECLSPALLDRRSRCVISSLSALASLQVNEGVVATLQCLN